MIFIDTQSGLQKHLSNLFDLKYFGFDTETTGLDCHRDKLQLVQLGTKEEQWIIDARKVDIQPLKPLFENRNVAKYGANLSFDYKFLRKQGIRLENCVDVMIADLLIFAGKIRVQGGGNYTLETIAERHCNIRMNKNIRESFLIHKGDFSYEQLEYAADDVIVPLKIYEQQHSLLLNAGLMPTAKLEWACVPVFGDIEYNGMYLNKEKWQQLIEHNISEYKNFRQQTKDLIRPFWDLNLMGEVDIQLSSKDQMLWAVRKMGYNVPDTREETLQKMLPKEHYDPIVKFREYETILNRYGENWFDAINPKTGRVHTGLFQLGTETGRPASRNPNLLNVKRENTYRNCFEAENGKIVTVDFEGQELRIMAEITREPAWVRAFAEDLNVHKIVGKQMFRCEVGKSEDLVEVEGVKVKQVDLYNITKNLNFGSAYGAGPSKLMTLFNKVGVPCTMERANQILNEYKENYATLNGVLDHIAEQTVEDGYSVSLGGRRRYFNVPKLDGYVGKEAYKEHMKRIGAVMREGRNHAIQGTGADELKRSLVILRDTILEKDIFDELKIVLCYSDDTKTLTETGNWKLFKDLKQGEKIAQYHNYRCIDFIEPSRIIEFQYKGKAHKFLNKRNDLIVTPNHRMLTKTQKETLKIEQAQNIKLGYCWSGRKTIHAGIKNYGIKLITKDEFDELEIAIAIQADGTFRKDCNSFQIRAKNPYKVMRLHQWFGDRVKYSQDGCWWVHKTLDTIPFIWKYIDKNKNFKFNPLFNLNLTDRIIFLKILSKWDGQVRGESFRYDQTYQRKKSVDTIMAIAAISGFRTAYTNENNYRYYLNYTSKDSAYINNNTMEHTLIDYNSTMHCVTVPSNMILVKRNKNIMLQGNCPYDEIDCESEKNHEEHLTIVEDSMLLGQEFYQNVIPAAVEGEIAPFWKK